MQAWYHESFGVDYLRVYQHRSMQDAINEIERITRWFPFHPEELILDLCCGAGRHTVALAERKLPVIGIDLSEVLLSQAQKNAGTLPIPFVLGDMRHLPFMDDVFGVVLNLFTSFGYFVEDEENQQVLEEIVRVLKPQGRFIVDYMNEVMVRESLIPFSKRELEGLRIEEKRYVDGDFVYKDILIVEGEEERRYRERVKLYSEEQMRMMMEKAGLRVEAVYGDFNGAVFHRQSERMIFIGGVSL